MYEDEKKCKKKTASRRQETLGRPPLFESLVIQKVLQGTDYTHFNFNCDKHDASI